MFFKYVKIQNEEVGLLLDALLAGPILHCKLASNEALAHLLMSAFPSFTYTSKPQIEEGKKLDAVYTELPYNKRHKENYQDRWIRHELHVGGAFVVEQNKLGQFLGMTWEGK